MSPATEPVTAAPATVTPKIAELVRVFTEYHHSARSMSEPSADYDRWLHNTAVSHGVLLRALREVAALPEGRPFAHGPNCDNENHFGQSCNEHMGRTVAPFRQPYPAALPEGRDREVHFTTTAGVLDRVIVLPEGRETVLPTDAVVTDAVIATLTAHHWGIYDTGYGGARWVDRRQFGRELAAALRAAAPAATDRHGPDPAKERCRACGEPWPCPPVVADGMRTPGHFSRSERWET